MRLFVALDIDTAIRQRLQEFVNELRAHAPGVPLRWPGDVSRDPQVSRRDQAVEEIERALPPVRGVPFEIAFRGSGFFPAAKRARVFWAGIEAPGELQALAARIDEATRTLGFPPERGPYKPHLTLARPGSGNPRGKAGERPDEGFQAIQQYLSGKPAPEFGTMTAHEFFLFESILSPRGATYRKVRRYPWLDVNFAVARQVARGVPQTPLGSPAAVVLPCRSERPGVCRTMRPVPISIYIFFAVLAYLLGSIPFGYILVRLFLGTDVRQTGSGNIGATNVARTGSKGLAIATLAARYPQGLRRRNHRLCLWHVCRLAAHPTS